MTSIFPYIFHEGISVKFTTKKKSNAIDNLRVMFEKQMLDETDTNIMIYLQKYGYLNAFLLRILLNRHLEECKDNFINLRLKKLEKLGFVTRFQFFYTDQADNEHATPFIYNLTTMARKIFPTKDDGSFEDGMNIDCVQRRLSYNQFHIMLEEQYGSTLLYSSYQFGKEYDGLYKVMSNGKPLIFYVFSIRQGVDWGKSYLKRLREFRGHVDETKVSYSGLIIICENEYQSLKAEQVRSGDKELHKLDVYYICDYSAVKEGTLLQHIIQVNPDNNSYDIMRINVDGPVRENFTVEME